MLPVFFKQTDRGILRLFDFIQVLQVLVRALHNVNRDGFPAFTVAVAAPRGLHNAVHTGGQPNHARK